MPTVTTNLGLKKPLGNETVSRTVYNENLDILDQNAAKFSDLAAHLADVAKHRVMHDATKNANYVWKVDNGQMYIEEVV